LPLSVPVRDGNHWHDGVTGTVASYGSNDDSASESESESPADFKFNLKFMTPASGHAGVELQVTVELEGAAAGPVRPRGFQVHYYY
jgi:hypothetical protein